MDRRQKIMGGIALVVTLLCIGFLTWALWPKAEIVIPPETTPAAAWIRKFGEVSGEHAKKQDAFYWATARITTEATADKQGVVIAGKVNTAQELALLKAELGNIQPSAPLDWKVTVGK